MRHFMITLCLGLFAAMNATAQDAKQYYELRQYTLAPSKDAEALDNYLNNALAPALNRAGVETVGLFKTPSTADEASRFVLIPMESPADLVSLQQKLGADSQYQADGKAYLETDPTDPIVARIRSELLIAFDVQPKLSVPPICADKKDRIFELRTYESATELRGNLKVEMFNSGEVPIFLDCGIKPIFFGQAIIGDKMPNLTYLTVYANEAEKADAWDQFRAHPDWKVLSKNARYAKTVSQIHKWDLVPMKGSQL